MSAHTQRIVDIIFDGERPYNWENDRRIAQIEQLMNEREVKILESCYVDQGEIYVRFKGGFAEQYERIKQLKQEGEK